MDHETIDRSKYVVPPRPTQVRINEPFCYDRDITAVARGNVVYADQLALDREPMLVASGGLVLKQIIESPQTIA